MQIMAKKPAKPDADQSLDGDEKKKVGATKISLMIDNRILAFIAQYQNDQKETLRFKPTQRDVVELALLEFAKQEGYTIDMRDE